MRISSAQWNRVKELYEAALEHNPAQRPAFVRQNEPDDVVREEVDRLLAEHERLGSFLSTPAFIDRYAKPTGPTTHQFSPGEVLVGRFRILDFVSAGGMGEVYKAEDTRLERIVALKSLPREFAQDREFLDRFRREAKSASALNHPYICTVYDFGEDSGRVFIAMEYLEGESLSGRLKRGPIPFDEVVTIAIAIATALSVAHGKSIIHRDLKPGNIMLTSTGAKLLDFGLAKNERCAMGEEATETVLTREAHVAGTLPYMSPEQLQAKEVDARGDIFAFGAVLYEMLSGKRAFACQSRGELIAAIDRDEPEPLRRLVKDLPEALERIVQRCLRKRPEERYTSMTEILRELEDCRTPLSDPASGINLKVLIRQTKRPWVAIPSLIVLLVLMSLVAWWIHHNSRVAWAKNRAVPQIGKLIEQGKNAEAYALAVLAEQYIPKDPMLTKFWPDISWSDSIDSIPRGASVYRKSYNALDSTWEFVGQTPIEKRRFPSVDSNWRFELKGYTTVERATFPNFYPHAPVIALDQNDKAPAGMVRVQLSNSDSKSEDVGLNGLPGLETLPQVPLNNYWIDKFEVTNEQFKRFIDQEGYKKRQYWREEFRNDNRVLSWAEAMKLFVDKTGRPGPAEWVQGEYPHGERDYPVTGISWFEAAAYAEFAGKALPTIYHWRVAARTWTGASMIPASNFDGRGAARVGEYGGMSWIGALDLAGNVKEWVLNEASSGKRYIMGGAWNEPTYMFYDADARSPFQRSTNFGFRCAKYLLTGDSAKAAEPVVVQIRDYSLEKPVPDQVFEAYKSLYSYDKTRLNAVVQSVKKTDDWKQEKITFDAAYGNERMIAYLFLPAKAKPPYQAVVNFPASGALHTDSSADLDGYLEDFEFIIRSGRAVMLPIYKGTFERGASGDSSPYPNTTSAYRDRMIMWSKDLGRSIDYLETRSDIDHEKLAYEGYSLGAALGSLLPGVEPRFKALVLICGGFWLQKRLPEADQINFAPRIKAPVLMLSGRFDYIFPTGTSQEPMFRLFGTRKEDKRLIRYDTGHDIPNIEIVKQTLNWLDRYLGPVK